MFLAEGENCGCVTDGRVPHIFALIGLVVVEELEVHPEAVCPTLPKGLDCAQEDPDGVTPANGIAEFLQVVGKSVMVQSLNDLHALKMNKKYFCFDPF